MTTAAADVQGVRTMPAAGKPETGTRQIVVFVNGSLSLFRASGIYYLRELIRKFDVVLVGGTDYAGDRAFEIAKAWPGVKEVHLLPPAWQPRTYHRASVVLANDLRERIRPAVLLQHADCYPHNLYLIRAATRIGGVLRATFANAFTPDHQQDFAVRSADEVARISTQWNVAVWLATVIFWARSFYHHVFRFVIVPISIGQMPLNSHTDLDSGVSLRRDTRSSNDVHYLYDEDDRRRYLRVLRPGVVEIIRHPISDNERDVNGALDMPLHQERIAFLPTWGIMSVLAERVGSYDQAMTQMIDMWSEALSILRGRLGPLPICAKLHPAAAHDPRMLAMFEGIRSRVADFKVVDPTESAERLVIGSSVVLSDASSILWWAAMIGDRVVISMDAWALRFADAFRDKPSITYVRGLDELRTLPLVPHDGRSTNARPRLIERLTGMLTDSHEPVPSASL
jgi:hypothetical protein